MEKSSNQLVYHSQKHQVELWLKREDLIHPFVSGNKFRKLKYNLQEAKAQEQGVLLTFGGAFSNHIAATAYAAHKNGLKSIGVIRGEELVQNIEKTLQKNATLRFAHEHGMQFYFVSRQAYREKKSNDFIQDLKNKFGDFYLLPEGGTNELAVKGCKEILTEADQHFDYVCCPVGTGGTISGIIESTSSTQRVIGFPALKGDFLRDEIQRFTQKNNWSLTIDYHFGGYAKVNLELVNFMNGFFKETGTLLDPIYTGKMMFGLIEQIDQGLFSKNTRILAVHTGGLQGIAGINQQLARKGMPLIEV